MDDDECLELAEAIKSALIFLVKELSSQKSIRKTFIESIRKLLDTKSKK